MALIYSIVFIVSCVLFLLLLPCDIVSSFSSEKGKFSLFCITNRIMFSSSFLALLALIGYTILTPIYLLSPECAVFVFHIDTWTKE